MRKEQIEKYWHSPWMLEILPEVTSTNDVLKKLALAGCPERTVIIADRQTGGKGRMGRSFYSPQDNGIYLSLLLRPSIRPQEALQLTTAAASAAAMAIDEVEGGPAMIKWVNDIYCRGRKTAGILTEAGFSGEDLEKPLSYAVVGIGFNVFEPEEGYPEGIRNIAGAVFSRDQRPATPEEREDIKAHLTAAFLDRMDQFCRSLSEKTYMESYREKSFLTGKEVLVLTPGHETKKNDPVRVIGIGDDAELIVQDQEGKISRLFSGEVSVREI